MASLNAAAAHVFCATKTFNEKVAAGVTKRARPNEWDLDVVRRDFFAHFRAGASGRARAAGALDLSTERARLARAQTEAVEFKKSPVSSSRGDVTPHMFIRTARLQLGNFAINDAKRLLQQYRPIASFSLRCDNLSAFGAERT